jgi:hypothetical protein
MQTNLLHNRRALNVARRLTRAACGCRSSPSTLVSRRNRQTPQEAPFCQRGFIAWA